MICQKVKLIKYKTDDGCWDISNKTELPPIGSFFWIDPNSWKKRALDRNSLPIMGVLLEDGRTWVPVEVLDFTNEYEDRA
jgi:hypothetical protein